MTFICATIADPLRGVLTELIGQAQQRSRHPLARPIIDAAAEAGLPTHGFPETTELVPGKGIMAEEVSRLAALGRRPIVVALATADIALITVVACWPSSTACGCRAG